MSMRRRIDRGRIAELEREREAELRRQDRERERAIATAECNQFGHVEPEGGSSSESFEIVVWESMTPIRFGPHCSRCGASLLDAVLVAAESPDGDR